MVRLGFVGGGWVTCNRHLPAAFAHPRAQSVGLVTKSPTSLWQEQSVLARKFGLRHFGYAMSEPWFMDGVDVAVIGTPPDTHYPLVMEALDLGKHVLVEKPFALTVAQADEMARKARRAGRLLGVVHNFQFAGATLRARQMVENGRIGRLRGVLGFQCSNQARRLPTWYRTLPLGLFTDESPHLLYLLRLFLGSALPQQVFVGPPLQAGDRTPHTVAAQFLAGDDAVGSLYMNFAAALSEWQFVLFGSQRTLLIDLFRDVLMELPNDGAHSPRQILMTSFHAVHTHLTGVLASGMRHLSGRLDYGNRLLFHRFIEAVQEGAPHPPQDIAAEDGQAVVELMAQIGGRPG